MNLAEVLLLAIVQGLTEFLPISSSGHLVIVERLLDMQQDPQTVNIALHAGTLLAVLLVYRRHLARILLSERRAIGPLIVGTLPLVILGLPAKLYLAPLLSSAMVAGVMLLVTGGLLIWGSRQVPGETDYTEVTFTQALVIGLFQAVAILPGLSRSGSTIVAGLLMGLKRESAATFSFLLAIPAIGGASLFELLDLIRSDTTALPIGSLLLGVVVSMLVGLAALWWLLRWLQAGRLEYFALWCIPLGLAICFWQFLAA